MQNIPKSNQFCYFFLVDPFWKKCKNSTLMQETSVGIWLTKISVPRFSSVRFKFNWTLNLNRTWTCPYHHFWKPNQTWTSNIWTWTEPELIHGFSSSSVQSSWTSSGQSRDCILHKIILKFDKEILKKIMLDCRTSQ